LELIQIEKFVGQPTPKRCGRKLSERRALARAFVGKAVYKSKRFWLIYRMANSKTGVSITGMQRELEINDYKTIWVMAHKIR
jgi:hypothetical protein